MEEITKSQDSIPPGETGESKLSVSWNRGVPTAIWVLAALLATMMLFAPNGDTGHNDYASYDFFVFAECMIITGWGILLINSNLRQRGLFPVFGLLALLAWLSPFAFGFLTAEQFKRFETAHQVSIQISAFSLLVMIATSLLLLSMQTFTTRAGIICFCFVILVAVLIAVNRKADYWTAAAITYASSFSAFSVVLIFRKRYGVVLSHLAILIGALLSLVCNCQWAYQLFE